MRVSKQWHISFLGEQYTSIFCCIEISFYSEASLSLKNTRTAWCCYTTLSCWDGIVQVMSSAYFLHTWCFIWNWGLSDLRLLFLTVRESPWGICVCVCIPSGFSCVFTEERVESDHSAIKPRSVEFWGDVCPCLSCLELNHQLLSHHSNQGPSPIDCSALGRVFFFFLVVPNIFHYILWKLLFYEQSIEQMIFCSLPHISVLQSGLWTLQAGLKLCRF